MQFETIVSCHELEVLEDGVTLHNVTTRFRPNATAIILYARTSPFIAGMNHEFVASIYRVTPHAFHRVWREPVAVPPYGPRWLPQQLLAIYYPHTRLGPGEYLGTIELPSGDEAQATFVVSEYE